MVFSVLICSLSVMPVWAQDFLNHVTAGVGAGFTFPQGSLAAHTKTGFNFVATGGPRFNPRFSLTLDFSLHYLDVKDAFHTSDGVELSFGSVARLWSLTVNPDYEFVNRERFSAYATGGYGLYNRRLLLAGPGLIPGVACVEFWSVCVTNTVNGAVVSGDLNPYKGGYNVGAGVNFGKRTKFFAEARYHHMFTRDATEVIPLTFGIRW